MHLSSEGNSSTSPTELFVVRTERPLVDCECREELDSFVSPALWHAVVGGDSIPALRWRRPRGQAAHRGADEHGLWSPWGLGEAVCACGETTLALLP